MTKRKRIKHLDIKTEDYGFYRNFSKIVTVASKIVIMMVVVWILSDIERSGAILQTMKNWSFTHLNSYYMYTTAFYVVVCLIVVLYPPFGKTKLGPDPDGKPEFSTFSWFSMIFGAGIGIGVLTYSAAEPMWHMANNPDIIKSRDAIMNTLNSNNIVLPEGADAFEFYQEQVTANVLPAMDNLIVPYTMDAVEKAYQWSFLHWGLHAWAVYCLVGISLAYFSYRRGLPLTMRSALAPLFGKTLEGPIGHVVDICAVVATIFGMSQTIGLGLSSFVSGLYSITGFSWLVTNVANPEPSTGALLLSLFIVMLLSTASALSGVGRGVKWLSNMNMILSFSLLAFFVIFGATMFALEMLFKGTFNYVIHLPAMALSVWDPKTDLGVWQTSWSVFYWAWWIAFAPFVGMFLARISKYRTIREFGLIALVAPSFMLFIWFALIGSTGIDLELSGVAQGNLFNASLTAQLFEILNYLLTPAIAQFASAMVVLLLLTYQVTSGDSAIIVVNTINSGGEVGVDNANKHILVWAFILTALIGALLLAGGFDAITSAMIVAAIPFSLIATLMGISLLRGLIWDRTRPDE
ncbi:BCCT family transporter [Psychrobacter lutiphocae]|uniref:BCCT family transporter n=1 Tax=Psychrobacter lutiphocae TaxID=540500 RepID=UPI00037D9827|nr:BCCT family transporter [Psychrobacter lutiphocae]